MHSIARPLLLAVLLVLTLLAPRGVAGDREPTLRKWRDFVFGRMRPDMVEYFDFEVKEDAFRVFLSFDRGQLGDMEGPRLLLKYGMLPTTSSFDQQIFLNESSNFYSAKVNNLRSGRYYVALIGSRLYDSIKTFVGDTEQLFFFLNVWYFGCSDPSRAGSRCNVPVLPAAPIVTPTTTNVGAYYKDRGVNTGCVDGATSSIYYTIDVPAAEWDLKFTLTTSAASSLRVVAGANIREPADVADGSFSKSALIAAGTGERSVDLSFSAPIAGQWMIMVNGAVTKGMSCASGSGASFKLTAKHERDCARVDGGLLKTSDSLPTVNLCALTFRRLNEMRNSPFKKDHLINVDFAADLPVLGDGKKKPAQTQAVAGYVVELPDMYAGSNLALEALVTANVPSFQIYARVGAYPTPQRFDYQFNSSDAVVAARSDNMSADWAFEVQRYAWQSVVYPKVGAWHLLLVADGALAEPAQQSNNASFWAADVSLHSYACPEDACSGHGACAIAETYRGLNYGACSCHYGYGGEQCDVEAIDPKFRSHQIFMLIFSNAAILPVTVLCCRRKLFLESVLFFSTGLISSIYHACDTEVACIFPYTFLQQMDFALSFNMIMLLTVHFSGARKQAKAGIEIVLFLLTIVMATNNATSMANWVLIGAFCVLQFSVTLVYYFVMGAQRMGLGKMTALKQFALYSHNFDRRYGILGSLLWIGALSCWFTSSPQNYWLIHSIWHIGAMISAFCFIGFRANDRYQMLSPTTGVDVLGPNYTTNAAPLKPFSGAASSITIASEKELSVADEA